VSPAAPAVTGGDAGGDMLPYGRSRLDAIFTPKSGAVIGATERPASVGRTGRAVAYITLVTRRRT